MQSFQQPETGIQVLVVSRDHDIHKLLYFFLTQAGYQVLGAGHKDAANVFYANRVDLVLLDLMASPSEGLGVCQQLRLASDVPLLVLTEVSQPDQVVSVLELGADDAIHYPFAMVEILARMQALLRRRLWNNGVEDALVGKRTMLADAPVSPIWLSESLLVSKSSYLPGIQ